MRSVAEILRWRARFQPKAIALQHRDRLTTYAQLNTRANRLANALIAEGVAQGDRVAVLDKGHDRLVETIFGIAKVGAVFTPISWRLTAKEIQTIIADAGAKIVFVGDEFAGKIAQIQEKYALLDKIITYNTEDRGSIRYEALLDKGEECDPCRDGCGQDTAWQMYTSGTTGLPRGVELTHDNLFSMCTSGIVDFGGPSPAIVLACMPLFHIGGSGFILHALFAGSRVIITREANSIELLDLLEQEGVTHALFVPAMLNSMLQQRGVETRDFSRLRTIIYGASPISEDLLSRSLSTFRCELLQAYGLTETSGAVAMLAPHDHEPTKLKSCGLPILAHDVKIADRDGRECSPGTLGEIIVRGPNIMKGYWNKPEATAAALQSGWFKTGDAGYRDEAGYIFIHDRIKDMIVSGGENVYSIEVESALHAHPAVADVAVIGVPDDRWGEAEKRHMHT